MQVNDRVSHKKYGLGTVKAVYPKYHAVRVLYDGGKESTNAEKKLRVVTEDYDQPIAPPTPTEPSRVSRGRSAAGTSRVDYDLLDRAKAHFELQFPSANHVSPKLYQGRAYCEVWTNTGATIHFYEED